MRWDWTKHWVHSFLHIATTMSQPHQCNEDIPMCKMQHALQKRMQPLENVEILKIKIKIKKKSQKTQKTGVLLFFPEKWATFTLKMIISCLHGNKTSVFLPQCEHLNDVKICGETRIESILKGSVCIINQSTQWTWRGLQNITIDCDLYLSRNPGLHWLFGNFRQDAFLVLI